MTSSTSNPNHLPPLIPKTERNRFWLANLLSTIAICIAGRGVLFGLFATMDDFYSGFVLLGSSFIALVATLIPWVLSQIGQQQRDHFDRVERHLGIKP